MIRHPLVPFAPMACFAALVACAEPLQQRDPLPAAAPTPASPEVHGPITGDSSAKYADPRNWLCLPGRADPCAADIRATELRPDGSRVELGEARAAGADDVDCIYLYPTVDMRMVGASNDNFGDPHLAFSVARQFARFRSVCNLYAPFYRQTTIGAYLMGPAGRRPYLEIAQSDVDAAFQHYMAQYNRGHKIVLVGHSQGGEMLVHLLKRFFDDDPAMRERLLLAMPIGWPMEVAPGQTTGGTFAHLPVCTRGGETGCIIGFRTYEASSEASRKFATPSPGKESVCVNPAELSRGPGARFAGAYFLPIRIGGIGTPFVMLPDFYAGRCMAGLDGFRYLGVREAPDPGDVRIGPFDLSARFLHSDLGMHAFDFQFTQADLIALVARSAHEH